MEEEERGLRAGRESEGAGRSSRTRARLDADMHSAGNVRGRREEECDEDDGDGDDHDGDEADDDEEEEEDEDHDDHYHDHDEADDDHEDDHEDDDDGDVRDDGGEVFVVEEVAVTVVVMEAAEGMEGHRRCC